MKRNSDRSLKITAYIVTSLFALVILLPFIFIFSNSLKDNNESLNLKPKLIPNMSKSMNIVIDYTNSNINDEESLKEALMIDSSLALYSTIYELDEESIFEVKFYGVKDGKTIFYTRGHRNKLQMELDFGIFGGATVKKEIVGDKEKAIELVEELGYKYNINGLDIKRPIEKSDNKDYSQIINSYIKDKYGVIGTFASSSLKDNPLLMLESYKYYYIMPATIYKDNPTVNRYNFFIFIFNTFFTISFGIVAQVLLCSASAYAISRLLSKKVGNLLLIFFLGVCMIPFIAVMVPQFMLFKDMGWYDNYAGLLIPWLIPNGFFVYLFKGFFDKLPGELFDAMKIDGASEWYCYSRLCMPLSKPIIMIVALSTFLGGWNSFFWEWMIAQKQNLWTLNVAMYNISKIPTVSQNFLMGMSFVMILPVLILTFIFSGKIKESVANSGLKG